ncbi:molybdopterin-dependent oxidoreductase [Actinoplanes auranticolor]|uniref:Oxidoreductase n=1 Tax=Actinoplanes auranticolor TaxID=47988 RepID=A0A919S418_9ACTN|nr:molybdopterin-dependent oxidoreductase [Actinoplanes auranticolor]GIM63727.1 oxidoreductase [Actinoplanes auranticolor]
MKLSLRAALAGVAAAGVALGVAELVAVFTGPLSSPLFAVGGVVVNNVPAPVKDAGIAIFGTHDKTALITGTAILLAVYAALLGVLALRSRTVAATGIALFAVIGVVAALTRNDAGLLAALPTLVSAGAAFFALRYLLGAAVSAEPAAVGASPSAYREDGRRRFLIGLGTAAGIAAVGGVGGRLLTSRRAVTSARNAVVLPAASAAAPVPAGAQVAGATPYVTSNKNFYRIDTALYLPQVDPSTWELRIHGMVRNPITITWEQLLQRPMVQRYITLACVSNEVGGDLIGNALWLGTPIKDLLDEAQPLPDADQVVQRSSDGWNCGTPTAVLRDGRDALLAVGMNGEPLPVRHGFPVRMVVPGLYGYVSACKWITEIELTRFSDFDAYWVPRGWSALGPIKTESRIDTPRDGAERKAGPVTVAGVAWAQHRGITKVEVQVDDGPWAAATLAPVVSVDTWVQWSYSWPATAGEHTLRVRATDKDGQTQTSTPAPPAPDGATGWHSVQVTVG